jgi:hypothetical protein
MRDRALITWPPTTAIVGSESHSVGSALSSPWSPRAVHARWSLLTREMRFSMASTPETLGGGGLGVVDCWRDADYSRGCVAVRNGVCSIVHAALELTGIRAGRGAVWFLCAPTFSLEDCLDSKLWPGATCLSSEEPREEFHVYLSLSLLSSVSIY